MAITAILIDVIGLPIAKFLFKHYLGEAGDLAADAASGSVGTVNKKIIDYRQRRRAERRFQDLGKQIVEHLAPLFERETRRQDLNPEAVAHELARTLEALSSSTVVQENIDPVKIVRALRKIRPLPTGQFSEAERELYDRALDQCVRYIAGVAATLPKFQEQFAAESLSRHDGIGDILAKELDAVQRIEQRLAATENATKNEAARFEADYRQAIIRNLDYLELFGADIAAESQRHSLSVAYVSLNLTCNSERKDTQTLSAEGVLASLRPGRKRLLIRGEAGSGKSTLFRWVAINAASMALGSRELSEYFAKTISPVILHASTDDFCLPEVTASSDLIGFRSGDNWKEQFSNIITKYSDALRNISMDYEYIFSAHLRHLPIEFWRVLVPFIIPLRECQDGEIALDVFPGHVAGEIGRPPAGWIREVLKHGRGLVLLDGVDEVPNDRRTRLRQRICGVCRPVSP